MPCCSAHPADGLLNPYSQYGSPYSNKSWNNPYAKVHRGPDKFPRRNVIRAIILKALTDPGVNLDWITSKQTLEKLWRTGR